MSDTVFAALLAFAGYSLLNLGQAGQKIGLGIRADHPAGGWSLWVVATLATSVSFFIVFSAISIGAVSVVGAMAGTGLVSLAVFSRLVMGERLAAKHVAALLAIVAGAAVVALFDVGSRGQARIALLWGVLAAGTVVYSAAWLALRSGSGAGVALGGLSGFLGAYSQLFQELATAELDWSQGLGPVVRTVVSDPITLVWAGLSVVSMVVIQFSYRHGQATQIIPVFTGNFILVPVIGGVIVFGESMGIVQWGGVALIVAGSIVLGRRRASREEGTT